MKNEMRLYLIWILVLANLLYGEYWGLNALIVAVVTVGLMWYRNLFSGRQKQTGDSIRNDFFWYVGAGIWLISATSVFLIGGWFQIMMYLLSMTYFGVLQDRKPVSVPISAAQALQSFATGLVRFFLDNIQRFKGDQATHSKKLARKIILFSIGFLICVAFLKLYQAADEDFFELTKFINLDWISWGFIFFYILLGWILYGFYYFRSEPEITKLDESFRNEIDPEYSDGLQRFFGVKHERILATFTLLVLNVMLLLLLSLDVRFLLTEIGVDKPVGAYSSAVHQGINALIFSLVLVIVLISFFFRGSLNFENHKSIKWLGLLWLTLNCILVITTGVKNYDYISEFGYTYKRLGVLLYLFLCGIGLVFSIYKIVRIRTVWFLIRNTSLSFGMVFALVGLFNWNKIIAEYNIEHIQHARLDLEYLYGLGPDSYPYLMDFHTQHNLTQTELFYRLVDAVESEVIYLDRARSQTSWRSYTVRDAILYKQLNRYHFTYEGDVAEVYAILN